MISKSLMNHHAGRAFALAELIDTTYAIAFDCLNEGGNHGEALARVKELLFVAQEHAATSADFLSDLIGECEADPAPQPAKRRAKA